MPPVNRVVEHVLVDATQHMLHLKGPEGLLGYCTNAGIFGGTIFFLIIRGYYVKKTANVAKFNFHERFGTIFFSGL